MDHIRLRQLTTQIEEMRARLLKIKDPQARKLLLNEMRECFREADAIIRTDVSVIFQNVEVV